MKLKWRCFVNDEEIKKLDDFIRAYIESDTSFNFIRGLRMGAEWLAKEREELSDIHDN